MIRFACPFSLVLGLASICHAAEVVVDARTFRVPDGFEVIRAAGPPLVDRPIVADFDELGRLYVADSSGSNDRVQEQEVDRPHRIVRLEDSDGDGVFDRSTVFADRMMFPEGAMWLDGSLYVAAPPSIWKLTDTDGDGVADRREEWFRGKTLTGCANDLHGPYAGPDGRVYWCKGAFAPQTYDRPGKKPLQTRAAHIFRARPDGTEVEPVMTGGMDNPVDVAFTPEGERIFTTTFLQHPGGGNRDGLIHAWYGGVYGKAHDVIDGQVRTGPELQPPLVHLGPAAPAGLARVESDALGFRNNLLAACFNLRKVARVELTPKGGTFEPGVSDLIASDDLDFHPTDVQEDADGSVLVVDTGGWYKICCPTSQLVKPDVLGSIYRVRRKDAPRVDDPRGLKIDWATMAPEALAQLLGDPRPAVARRAVAELAKRGKPAIPALREAIQGGKSVEIRRHALWAACRIPSAVALGAIRAGLDDPVPSIRHSAANALGLWRDERASDRLVALLADDPAVARASAEALGRIGPRSNAVPGLLRASGSPDPSLRHSATYALIEIGDAQALPAGLHDPSPLVRKAAMVALDQVEGGKLGPEPVIAAFSDPSSELREAAWWVAARHPEWGERLVSYFRTRLGLDDLRAEPRLDADLDVRLASLAKSPAIRDLIGEAATRARPPARLVLLRAMALSGLKDVPSHWRFAVLDSLSSTDEASVRQAVATLKSVLLDPRDSRSFTRTLFTRDLVAINRRGAFPIDLRLGALAAVPGGLDTVEPDLFAFLLDRLRPEASTSERSTSADVLAKAKLTEAQGIELTGAVASAGPIELPRLLDAFDRQSDAAVGSKLVDALTRNPARAGLAVAPLKAKLSRFGPDVAPRVDDLVRAIEAESADRRGRLEGMLANLKDGDVRRGQAIFNGPKASCIGCHAVGYVGGKLGPDLTRIGQVRSERDLLESIVYPSASLVRSYEPVAVATKDGRVVSGLVVEDSADRVVLAVAADREERIARDQVEEIKPGTVSVMPEGLDRQITPGELADLIAFLRACR